jgi:histidinol-phosphatase (PHP family)
VPPIRSNYHTHSRYCDAKGEIEAYLEAALAAGLDSYGVSSHAPLPFDTGWTMRLADLPAYCAEVRRLQAAYRDRLPVFLGLELDYYPGLEAFHRDAVLAQGLDYVVGSVHYVGHAGPGEPWCVDESDEVMREGIARSFGGDARRMVE